MCLLYCLRKENTHTPCKNRSARLPQQAAATASDTLGAVNVENQGAQGSDKGSKTWRWMVIQYVLDGGRVGGWVEQLGE